MGGGLGALRIIFFCCLPFFVENFVNNQKGDSDGKKVKRQFWLQMQTWMGVSDPIIVFNIVISDGVFVAISNKNILHPSPWF